MSPKLGSYLRTFRLKAGLKQKDIAALLGLKTGDTISRMERRSGIPSLTTLLGYCVIFEAHPQELVPGIYGEIEKIVLVRASVLIQKLEKRQIKPGLLMRLKFLENLSRFRVRYAK